MASNLEFVEFVCDQLRDAGEITYKKMFGEYGIYCDGKFFATVEEDQFGGMNITDKERFCWTSMIRQPEFVTEAVFQRAKGELQKKKPQLDLARTRLEIYKEGFCAQIMHKGPYDDEPVTIKKLEQFIEESGYVTDITEKRWHHEIYLSDPRKAAPKNLKTVIRHPIRKAGD